MLDERLGMRMTRQSSWTTWQKGKYQKSERVREIMYIFISPRGRSMK